MSELHTQNILGDNKRYPDYASLSGLIRLILFALPAACKQKASLTKSRKPFLAK